FVRFSGQALTQGVVNMRIDGEPVRVYSVAKTIADCLKYRRKLGGNFALQILRTCIRLGKCSAQRLRHFATICSVSKLDHVYISEAIDAFRSPRECALSHNADIRRRSA